MPVGVIISAACIALGGVLGMLVGKKLSQRLKDTLNQVFGLAALLLGITSTIAVKNMPAVVLSIVIGTAIGVLLRLGEGIDKAAVGMQKLISRFAKPPKTGLSEKEYTSMLVTIIVLFCASATGIYGSIVSGMSGDHTILLSKAILDFFTAMIFACSLGIIVAFISVPQIILFLSLFFLAKVIYPLTTPDMIGDFKACGGVILLATAFRMMKVKEFPVADMIPAMIIVMPVSALWSAYILPLLG